jgi:uncharacterized surface protein with fasciclin (FAS1) repeats
MPNIIETAIAANNLQTLVAAIKAADLVEKFAERGPYTLFAPNDAAFAKLPAGRLDELLNDIFILKQLLIFHTVEDKLFIADVMERGSLQTMQGQRVGVASNTGIKINQANVVQSDIVCDNGIIHVLDAVLTLSITKSNAGTK